MATLQKGNKKINASCQVFNNEIRVVKAKTDEVRAWCIIIIPFHTSRSFFSLSPIIPLPTSFTCFSAPSSKAVNQSLLFRGHLCSARVRFYRSPVPLFAPYFAGGWGRWRPGGMRKAILYFHLSNRRRVFPYSCKRKHSSANAGWTWFRYFLRTLSALLVHED